jgi:hypothetical protein
MIKPFINVSLSITDEEILERISKDDVKDKAVQLNDDPIALAVSVYDRWVNRESFDRWASLHTATALPEHRVQADRIREYYCNRILVKKLKSGSVTPYYQELYELVTGRGPLLNRHLGMLYRLPYFYVEDTSREQLIEQFRDAPILNLSKHVLAVEQVKTLQPIKEILRSRRSSEIIEFWYRDEAGLPVLHTVNSGNPLIHLVRSLFAIEPMDYCGYYVTTCLRGWERFMFLSLSQMSVTKKVL